MAVTHKAYTFNPTRFQSVIKQNVFSNDQFDLDRLLDLAQKVVENASLTVQQNLESLRFNSEWLDNSGDIARTYLWYLIVLSQELSPTASLSNRNLGSYGVLRVVLPLVGWSTSEIQKLINGLSLHTLPEVLNHPLHDTERNALDGFGGWLSLAEIEVLKSRLEATKDHFSSSAIHSIRALNEAAIAVSATYSSSAEERLGKAYADGVDMLHMAMDKREALFMILD